MSVSQYVDSDALIWPLSSDGVYSVQSAYHLLVKVQHQDQPSSSNVEEGKGLWNGIWKLQVPQKVRHFLWRAIRESLPTKLNLQKRQVVANGLCEQCHESNEDSVRALWYCESISLSRCLTIVFLFFMHRISPNLKMCFSFCMRKFLLKSLLFFPWLHGVFRSVGTGKGKRLRALM